MNTSAAAGRVSAGRDCALGALGGLLVPLRGCRLLPPADRSGAAARGARVVSRPSAPRRPQESSSAWGVRCAAAGRAGGATSLLLPARHLPTALLASGAVVWAAAAAVLPLAALCAFGSFAAVSAAALGLVLGISTSDGTASPRFWRRLIRKRNVICILSSSARL